jgi:AraC-like DNA-binding protein
MKKFDRIPVTAANKIFAFVGGFGFTPEELCVASGLDSARFAKPNADMSFYRLFDLYNAAERLTGDPSTGLRVGELDDPKLYGLLGYLAINSRTVGDALVRLTRYQSIRSQAASFKLKVTGKTAVLSYTYNIHVNADVARHEVEQTFCTVVQFCRVATGLDWVPLELHFEHSKPISTTEHARIFRCPVRFGRPVTKLVFSSSFIDTPLKSIDPALGDILAEQAEEMLPEDARGKAGFSARIEALIEDDLADGEPSVDAIAKRAGVSRRTLQRRLSEEGITFQSLLEKVRADLARLYLARDEVTLAEISYLLGFSQPSAFHRAFRRWTGSTPRAVRKELAPKR